MLRRLRLARARPDFRVWLVGFLLLLVPSLAEGQNQPAPGDSIPGDTIAVPIPGDDIEPGDTIPDAIAEEAEFDTRVPIVPPWPSAPATGWGKGVTVLSREELMRLPGMTLLEFVERLPGVVGFRAGGFGRPEALTSFGFGGSRVRVFIDGMELDPVANGAFEIEVVPLLDLSRLTVTRELNGIRIDAETFRLEQPEAHSVVRLGTGVYQTRLLSAIFSRGFGDRSVGTGAYDLSSTRGFGVNEPYSHATAAFRYAYSLTPNTALQADYRQLKFDRRGTLFPRRTNRRDVSLSGTARLFDRIWLQALVARTNQTEEGDSEDVYDVATNQFALRGALRTGVLAADGSVRVRPGGSEYPELPTAEADFEATLSPMDLLSFSGGVRASGGGGAGAFVLDAKGTLSPLPGLSGFVNVVSGTSVVPVFSAATEDVADDLGSGGLRASEDFGWRAGVDLGGFGVTAGFAAFENDIGVVAPFGLPFDRFLEPVSPGPLTGLEAYVGAEVPGTGGALRLDGWYSRATDGLDRPYTPVESARAGIWAFDSFYDGQLEPSLRIEYLYRGATSVPPLDEDTGFAPFRRNQTVHLSLQIRILDVEAFLLWDNLLNNQSAIEFPGSSLRFPRIVYGAEWRFRN